MLWMILAANADALTCNDLRQLRADGKSDADIIKVIASSPIISTSPENTYCYEGFSQEIRRAIQTRIASGPTDAGKDAASRSQAMIQYECTTVPIIPSGALFAKADATRPDNFEATTLPPGWVPYGVTTIARLDSAMPAVLICRQKPD